MLRKLVRGKRGLSHNGPGGRMRRSKLTPEQIAAAVTQLLREKAKYRDSCAWNIEQVITNQVASQGAAVGSSIVA